MRGREEEMNKGTVKQPENNKMTLVNPYLLNNYFKYKWIKFSNKDLKWLNGLKKQYPIICCL